MKKAARSERLIWTPPPPNGPYSSAPIGRITIGTLHSLSIGMKNDPTLPTQTEAEQAAEWARYVAAHPDLYNPDGTVKNTTPGGTQPSSNPRSMVSGQSLAKGSSITSRDGRIRLTMQPDGNVVLTETSGQTVLWDVWTRGGSGGDRLVMQSDGNLVLYTLAGGAAWNSGTQGHSGAYLSLQDDGNMVIYDPNNTTVLWNAGARIPPPIVLPSGATSTPDPIFSVAEGMSTNAKVILGASALGAAGLLYSIFKRRPSV